MMTQSIKISDRSKDRISKLQSKMLLEHNIKLTQMEIFDILIDEALDDEKILAKLILKKKKSKEPKKEVDWDDMLANPLELGITDASEHIDETIAKGFD